MLGFRRRAKIERETVDKGERGRLKEREEPQPLVALAYDLKEAGHGGSNLSLGSSQICIFHYIIYFIIQKFVVIFYDSYFR